MKRIKELVMMERAALLARHSPDRSRKCGAIIFHPKRGTIAVSCNGFPHGITETDARHDRPAKYLWIEHAERNALYSAAKRGRRTAGCTMFLTWYPCADCARAIIQSGIVRLVCVEPDWNDPNWAKDFAVVREMLAESGVNVSFVEGRTAPVAA